MAIAELEVKIELGADVATVTGVECSVSNITCSAVPSNLNDTAKNEILSIDVGLTKADGQIIYNGKITVSADIKLLINEIAFNTNEGDLAAEIGMSRGIVKGSISAQINVLEPLDNGSILIDNSYQFSTVKYWYNAEGLFLTGLTHSIYNYCNF